MALRFSSFLQCMFVFRFCEMYKQWSVAIAVVEVALNYGLLKVSLVKLTEPRVWLPPGAKNAKLRPVNVSKTPLMSPQKSGKGMEEREGEVG